MATATEDQKGRTITMVIEKGSKLVGITDIAHEAAKLLELLLEREKIEVRGPLPGQIKVMGGGAEDEGIQEGAAEIKSLIDTIVGWLEKAAGSCKELKVTISIV